MKKILALISKIGSYTRDDDFIKLKKQFLVYQGLFMSAGGVLWGTLLFVFDYPLPSVIPYGYVVITAINFYFFSKYKNFEIARFVQLTISVLLPFLLQWSLGGYYESGGVMIWALLALVSSATYQEKKGYLYIWTIFVALTLLSLIADPYFEENYNMGVPDYVSLIFLVVNILSVSLIVYALMVYFERMNQTNLKRLRKSYTKLINSEKLAALGQISAGVAHEVNTPLGAIQSSAEESIKGFQEMITLLPKLIDSMGSEQEKDQFMLFLTSLQPEFKFLTTKEERELKKNLASKLKEIGVEKSRFIAERLVKVGIYNVDDRIKIFAKHPYFPDMVTIIYDLLNQQRNNYTIQVAVKKASRVVGALKSYLHTNNSEEKEAIDLAENIDVVLTIYYNKLKQGINVIKEFEDVPEVMGYSDQLNQVWTNLIINAIQAMNGTGDLTISIKEIEDYVQVSIKDTGCGIPKEIQEKIFEPFFTTKISGEGSGLGLDIIKRILDDHQGSIYFNTEENKGTTFFIELPINKTNNE